VAGGAAVRAPPQPRVVDGQWSESEGAERCRKDEEGADRCSGWSGPKSRGMATGVEARGRRRPSVSRGSLMKSQMRS
jgi:hypothetical protein